MKNRACVLGLVAGCLVAVTAAPARAGSHLWEFSEVFSNADGTIQFIELHCPLGADAETGLNGKDILSVMLGTSFVIPGNLTGPTGDRYLLFATPEFVGLPGAPTPDYIFPAGSVPFFETNGDTLKYFPAGNYDNWTFGTVPTDGVNSLSRDGTVGPNSPTNYAGETGSVDVSEQIPTASGWAIIAMTVAGLIVGTIVLTRRRANAAA